MFIYLLSLCLSEALDTPASVTITGRTALTLSRTRNRLCFRRPTWPSSTCSRRIRRKRSKRSASGLNTRPQDPQQKRPPRSTEMQTNPKDYVSIAPHFFTAYDAPDVDRV